MWRAKVSDTIAAIATPLGLGAICVVRLSGPEALSIAGRIVSIDLQQLPSHTARLARVKDKDELIDEALIIAFHGSASFTGEPVVEIQGHGGPLIAQKILRALVRAGARLAEPGEFSLRAYQNGKIDLAQAEAIQGMIHAKSERAHRLHMDQLRGSLSKVIDEIRVELLRLFAILEAWVDFPEEGLEFASFEKVRQEISAIEERICALENTYVTGSKITHGLRVCFVGAPNVGKSSLLNALLGKERSIVTDIAGTTRDYIEEELVIDGMLFHLVDTAGVREGADPIEQAGIKRTIERMEGADLVCALFDASRGINSAVLECLPLEKSLIIWNKIDIGQSGSEVKSAFGTVELSALKGTGLDQLKERFVQIAGGKESGESDLIITSERHRAALARSAQHLADAKAGLAERRSAEFVALDMRSAIEAISQITGGSVTEDLLDALFSQFCLGK